MFPKGPIVRDHSSGWSFKGVLVEKRDRPYLRVEVLGVLRFSSLRLIGFEHGRRGRKVADERSSPFSSDCIYFRRFSVSSDFVRSNKGWFLSCPLLRLKKPWKKRGRSSRRGASWSRRFASTFTCWLDKTRGFWSNTARRAVEPLEGALCRRGDIVGVLVHLLPSMVGPGRRAGPLPMPIFGWLARPRIWEYNTGLDLSSVPTVLLSTMKAKVEPLEETGRLPRRPSR